MAATMIMIQVARMGGTPRRVIQRTGGEIAAAMSAASFF
jgi:hypothetical protein